MSLSRINRLRIWFTVIVFAVLPVAAWMFTHGRSFSGRLSAASLPVAAARSELRTAQAGLGEIVKNLVIDGELRAVNSRTIFANSSDEAKIVYLAPEGSLVKAGDKVAELDNTSVVNRIKDISERLVSAQSEIVQLQSTQQSGLRDLDVELSRLWLAYEQSKIKTRIPQEVSSRREYQENQLALSKAKAEYEIQLEKIEQKKKENAAALQVKLIEREKLTAQLQKAKNDLSNMEMRATSEGMVLYADHWNERRKIQVGDVVWGGFPVVSLPDLSQMEVIAPVNEVDGPKISPGQKARISLDSYSQTAITGRVKEIAQTAVKAGWNSKAKVFSVVVSLDQTLTGIMKPGMSAQVSVEVGRSGQQLIVPRAAVSFDTGSPVVTRVEGEKNFRTVSVNILAGNAFSYAVAGNGGLKEGDRVVLRSIP